MRVSSARTVFTPPCHGVRRGRIGLVIGTLALVGLPAYGGETMGRLAHDDRLVVRGLTRIEPERLATALVADDELLLLSRPLASRKGYLAAVGEKATLALERAGFPDARATARVEAAGDGERLVVDVVEGQRYAAADIRIDGLPPDLSERLHRWLLSHRPPPGASPQAQDIGGEWSGTRWVDSRGLPARLEDAVWSPGQPAPFDPPFLRTVRTAVARFLRDEGYLAAARIVESRSSSRGKEADAPEPAASCDVAVRPDAAGATLVIAFENLPPPAALRTIEVLPGARTTAADLERTLGIGIGDRVTERDRLVWRERLRQSGRFVRHEVALRELPGGDGADAGVPGADVVATFDLEEYPAVTPLTEPLSREEAVMLSFRSWLLETLANEPDLVVSCSPASAAGAGDPRPAWECIVSTREGACFKALPGTPEACGVAVSAEGLACFLPAQAGSFTVPLPGRRRVTLDVSFSLSRGTTAGRSPFERQLQATGSLEPRPRDALAALAVTARIEPVACLSLVHEGKPTLVWEGDDLVVCANGVTARFDSRTGRLEGVDLADGASIAIDAAAGRFATVLATLRAAAGVDRALPDALVSSAVEFLTDDATHTAARRIAAAMGLEEPKLVFWQEIVTDVAGRLRRIATAGGFVAADRLAGAALDGGEDGPPPLVIPHKNPTPPGSDPLAQLTRFTTARAWRWTDRCCGRDSWPASLARVAAFAAARDISALWELTAYMGSTRHGPLALLVAASTAPTEALAAGLARQGQTRLSAEAFRADCEPLAALLRNAGLDLPLVMLLRTVDDEEARRLGRSLAGDERLLLPLVRELRSRESDADALGSLPEAVECWWRESLGAAVSKALADRSQLKTAGKPAPDAAPAR